MLTLAWDAHLNAKTEIYKTSQNLMFRSVQKPQNYFYLIQILQLSLHSVDIYTYDFSYIVISTIYLICRVKMEGNLMSLSKYRKNLKKSNNVLFVDKFGINSLFGEFL